MELNGEIVGFVGELHPKTEKDYDLKRTYVFDLNFDKLMSVSVGYINYQAIPRFPGISRDIALVVNRATPSAKLVNIIHEHGGNILQEAEVFDVYAVSYTHLTLPTKA